MILPQILQVKFGFFLQILQNYKFGVFGKFVALENLCKESKFNLKDPQIKVEPLQSRAKYKIWRD